MNAVRRARPVTVLVDAPVTKIRQGYGLDRTYLIECGPSDVPPARAHKVRVDIERNAYDHQSHYVAQVWTERGWATVARVAPESPDMESLPSYVCFTGSRRVECEAAVEELAVRLLLAAEAVLYS